MDNKISVLTMVYENDQFLKQCLESIDKIADQIIIVEGAWNPDLPHRSTDKSIEIATEFCKNNPKAELLFYNATYDLKLEQTNTYKPEVLANEKLARQMGVDRVTGDWFFLVDSDEIYKESDLIKLKQFLSDLVVTDEPFHLRIPAFVFYFDYSFGTEEYFQRISRVIGKPKLGYTDHLVYEHQEPITIDLQSDMIYMYHYGYIGSNRVKAKMSMWNQQFTKEWFDKFEETVKNKSFDTNQNYHLFNSIGYGANFKYFRGEHPDCIKKIMEI